MGQRRILILFRDNNGWIDATEDVLSIRNEGNYYRICFNSGHKYRFSLNNVIILEDCEILPVDSSLFSSFFIGTASHIYLSRQKRYFIDENNGNLKTINFNSWNEYIRFKNKQNCYLDYYSSLAAAYDKNGDSSFLMNQYDKINRNSIKGTVFEAIFKGNIRKNPIRENIIYPFSHNLSQIKAIKSALGTNISVIQGPPGTGKTQTILNIVGNLLLENKTVAVISNNNQATHNVYEKLEQAGYGFLCANLGNLDNRNSFFSCTHEKIKLNEEAKGTNFQALLYEEENYFSNENKLANLLKEKTALELEFSKYKNANENKTLNIKRNINSTDILNLVLNLETKHKERIGLFKRLELRIKYGIHSKEISNNAPILFEMLKTAYVKRKLEEIDEKISIIKERSIHFENTGCQKKILDYSKAILNKKINSRMARINDFDYTVDNFKRVFDDFIRRYPIILSSTYSLQTTVPESFVFDYIIVDEASQSTLTSILPSLAKGKNLVVVGDDKQLPPVIEENVSSYEKTIYKNYGISDVARDNGKSFLEFIQRSMSKDMPVTLLSEHYRCVDKIIGFNNERFYDEKLILQRYSKDGSALQILKTVPGNHARKNDNGSGGLYNQREIDEVVKLVETLPKEKNVAVITPYRRQAELLKETLPNTVEVGTIHTFQGRESDIVIISTVANDANDYETDKEIRKSFINNERMINVAISRAKDELILVTSDKIYHSKVGVLADLIKYMSYQSGCKIEEGQIHSVFDILYDDYEKIRKNKMHGNEIASEVLVEELLQDIFKTNEFSSLNYSMHVTLKSLIKVDSSKYSKEESKYLSHPWTHLDFVIFNKFDKIPILAIEIDGIAYHEQNRKQLQHDAIKDNFLNDNDLPMLRIKTNESNVDEIIVDKLRSILK